MKGRLAFLFAGATFAATPANAATCQSLTALSLPHTTITLARPFRRERSHRPDRRRRSQTRRSQICRVLSSIAATLRPTSDSDIKIEVWLPTANWNGKYQALGNGGWAGSILYAALGEALKRGYATSSTDTGHISGAQKMLGHPEKLIDYSYRAIHEMTVKAKAITDALYGSSPRLSYFVGCSAGGRQALLEAQRFPDDFHGIIAGAPAIDTTPMYPAARMWLPHATLKDPASFIPPAKYPMIHQAVVNACDAIDGLKDGLIDDPRRCQFDPKVLECKSGDGPSCLTAPQVEAATKIISPVKHPRTGKVTLPRLEPGITRAGACRPEARPTTTCSKDSGTDLQGPELGLETIQFHHGPPCAREPRRSGEGHRSQSQAVHVTRRKASHLSRVGRSAGRPDVHPQLLRQRARDDGRRGENVRLAPCVHGAWNGPLPRRRRTG